MTWIGADSASHRSSTTLVHSEPTSSLKSLRGSTPKRLGKPTFERGTAGEKCSNLSHQTSTLNPENVSEVVGSRALGLWNSIYDPHSAKLLVRLAESHPDLPVHILSSHYGPLLADGSPLAASGGAKIGRVLTSMIGIACLRAQQGVAPQVTSHVFGLKKSLDVGSGHEGELPVEGQEFLTTDEGSIWLLSQIDRIVETVAGGSTFAPHSRESKL